MSTTVYSGEGYKCISCEKKHLYWDVFRTWTCPDCNTPISIKLDSNSGTFVRLKPHEIKKGSHVSLDGINIYEVGDIQVNGVNYSVFLREYNRINLSSKDFYLVIQGT